MLLMKADIEHGYRSFRSICIGDDNWYIAAASIVSDMETEDECAYRCRTADHFSLLGYGSMSNIVVTISMKAGLS